MICVSVFYPHSSQKRFDHVYYAQKHMPLVLERLASHGMLRYEIQQGLSALAPGTDPMFACTGTLYFNAVSEFQSGLAAHGAEIIADIPNYTDIAPQFQISDVA